VKPQDGEHQRAGTPDAVRDHSEEQAADGGSDERQRVQQARGLRVHAELADQEGENQGVEHYVHRVEHPARGSGDQGAAFRAGRVARPFKNQEFSACGGRWRA